MKVNKAIRTSIGALWASLAVMAMITLTACGVFIDDPTTEALKHIRALVTMPEAEYRLKRKDIALREQTSIDYLRAMRVQNVKLSFDFEDIQRPEAKQRVVTVSVSEKRAAGGSHERARFRAHVEQNLDGDWQVVSFRQVE